jgi:hypothetical protein
VPSTLSSPSLDLVSSPFQCKPSFHSGTWRVCALDFGGFGGLGGFLALVDLLGLIDLVGFGSFGDFGRFCGFGCSRSF